MIIEYAAGYMSFLTNFPNTCPFKAERQKLLFCTLQQIFVCLLKIPWYTITLQQSLLHWYTGYYTDDYFFCCNITL